MKDVQQRTDVRQDYQIKRGAVKCESALGVIRHAVVVYDTAGNDSSGASNKTIAAHGLGVYLPVGAIITRAWYQVKTTFTSATDAATIALKINNANDVVTAIAISDASNPWDAANFDTKVGNYALDGNSLTALAMAAARAASWIGPLTAEKEITATVAVEALTAGKLVIFVEYFVGL